MRGKNFRKFAWKEKKEKVSNRKKNVEKKITKKNKKEKK